MFSVFQELSIQEESLPTSTESTNQVHTNRVEISDLVVRTDTIEILELPQNGNMEKENKNEKTELALNFQDNSRI